MNKRSVGTDYEKLAGEYLKNRGYQIQEYNFRCRQGEIDIIAKKNRTLIFVEVKFRRTLAYGNPLEAVDFRKQQRICRTALFYNMMHKYSEAAPCRFDVIAVYGDGSIRHVENAFEFSL